MICSISLCGRDAIDQMVYQHPVCREHLGDLIDIDTFRGVE